MSRTTQQPVTATSTPKTVGLLQRKCARCKQEEEDKKRFGIQTKLKVSQPGDLLEQEADRVAAQVMRMPSVSHSSSNPPLPLGEGRGEGLQRKPIPKTPLVAQTRFPTIQRQATGPAPTLNSEAQSIISSAGPSRPLPTDVRTNFESRFGRDFSHVQIHTGAKAASSAEQYQAKAYTLGQHVVFGSGQYQPETTSGRSLLAHELAHTVQQSNKKISRKRIEPTGNTTERDSGTSSESENWVVKEELAVVKNAGSVDENGGANLRKEPVAGSELITWLPQNTKVLIIRENAQRWIQVSVMDGEHEGIVGYMANWLVFRNLPDDKSVAYTVQSGDKLGQIVQNHKQYASYDVRTGDDARSLVMAIYAANKGRKGIRINKAKLEAADSNKGFFDFFDDYRSTTSPVYQSIELQAGETIWLPGNEFIEQLKSTGMIPKRSEAKNAAIAGTKGVAGFTTGIGVGFSQSFIDAVAGAKDLLVMIKDLLTGAAFDAAKEMVAAIRKMTSEDLKKFGSEAIAALKKMFSDGVESFFRNWNASSPYDRWHFRGKILGFILGEVAMALISGGIATAIKWAGKFTKIGAKITSVIRKIKTKLKKILPKGKRGKRSNRKSDGSNKQSDHAAAYTSARIIAETNDKLNTSLAGVMSQLGGLKAKYPFIKNFRYKRVRPGHYRIEMKASPYRVVDNDYTPETKRRFRKLNKPGKPVMFGGRQVYMQDELFSTLSIEDLQRCIDDIKAGYSPKVPKAHKKLETVELHHMLQQETIFDFDTGKRKPAPVMEVTHSQHASRGNVSGKKINPLHNLQSARGVRKYTPRKKIKRRKRGFQGDYADQTRIQQKARKAVAGKNAVPGGTGFRTEVKVHKDVNGEVVRREIITTQESKGFDNFRKEYWNHRLEYLEDLMEQKLKESSAD